jgi:hypothetical protein
MALDSFNISIQKIKVLPDFVVEFHKLKYPNVKNIVYALDVCLTGKKQNVSSNTVIYDVPVPYTSSNTSTDLINYDNLTEEIVVFWAENGLVLLKGEDAIVSLQNDIEKEINKKLLLPPETSLPWQANDN